MSSEAQPEEYETSRLHSTRFRFKSKPGEPYPQPQEDGSSKSSHRHRHRRHHRHHHHRHSRHRTPPTDDPPTIAPDDAFRESLFDAMADDEGASYWEGIYSQPIHTYERQWVRTEGDELRQMNDEEYAAYVRTEMWKKTREGMLAEREARQRQRRAWKREQERLDSLRRERNMFDKLMEESLKRGRERQSRKKEGEEWEDVWKKYTDSWERLNAHVSKTKTPDEQPDGEGNEKAELRNLIFWPVKTGKRKDISAEGVEAFFRHCPSMVGVDSPENFLAVLKAERVRWHPDKVQHRYGGLDVETHTMQSVTEVFQIIDRLWTEAREKEKK
ncbi:hypothetical protein AAP_05982 [Ascosphaera apis ARSEF 7405]|uniref:Uncharacterized protein n=1 Tax=Ascosphaera apis ARSEF 7405 TaxID=392613 RepID=A0A167V4L3_9EURO|nr:hypothetical protein AAP_05982 [Ascosphaera apis ARSEF 7405]